MKVEPKELEARIKMLETLGLNADVIQRRIPNFIPPAERILDAVTYLVTECNHHASIFERQPALLGFQRSTLERKMTSLRAAGITQDAIERAPELLVYDDARVKKNLAFLEDTLNVSREHILLVPWLLNVSLEKVVLPKVELFKKHNLPLSILTSRMVLYSCRTQRVEAAIDYMISRGISKEVFSEVPDALTYSVENNLKPKLEYLLDELGCSPTIFDRLPNILNSMKKTLEEKASYLQKECGFGGKEFTQAPNVFGLAASTLKRRVQVLYSLGITKETIRRFPTMLTLSDENIRKKIECVTTEFGLSVDVFNRYASLISLSLENLHKKFSYFVERGYSKIIFEKNPMLFALSLTERIAPRMAFLDSLGITAQPGSYLGLTDGKFCENIAHSTQQQYLEFRKALA